MTQVADLLIRAPRAVTGDPAERERPLAIGIFGGTVQAVEPLATTTLRGRDTLDLHADEVLLPGVTHWQHPRFFAYFANTAAEPAILAELLSATLNSVAFLWRTAPAATELEAVVLRALARDLATNRLRHPLRLLVARILVPRPEEPF